MEEAKLSECPTCHYGGNSSLGKSGIPRVIEVLNCPDQWHKKAAAAQRRYDHEEAPERV
jgi:hypothetical protein